jgi:hypothetical protein
MTSISYLNASVLTLFRKSSAGSASAAENTLRLLEKQQQPKTVAAPSAPTISMAANDRFALIARLAERLMDLKSGKQSETTQAPIVVEAANSRPSADNTAVSGAVPAISTSRRDRKLPIEITEGMRIVASRFSGLGHIGGLINMIQQANSAPERLKNLQAEAIPNLEAQLASATDPKTIARLENAIEGANRIVDGINEWLPHVDEGIRLFEAKVRMAYTVTGAFVAKDENGQYQWGKFSVNNRSTGEIYYSHNGDGKVVELDGIVADFIVRDLHSGGIETINPYTGWPPRRAT